jgi:hypothetical protein
MWRGARRVRRCGPEGRAASSAGSGRCHADLVGSRHRRRLRATQTGRCTGGLDWRSAHQHEPHEHDTRRHREGSRLGIQASIRPFVSNRSVMAMTGLPETGEYRLSTVQLPASNLILEFVEFKGLDSARAPVPSRVQDPGSFRLQLTFRDIDITLAALKDAGGQVISTGAMPARMTFGSRPWCLAVVPDPDNLFLIVQQGPSQRSQQEPAAAAKP